MGKIGMLALALLLAVGLMAPAFAAIMPTTSADQMPATTISQPTTVPTVTATQMIAHDINWQITEMMVAGQLAARPPTELWQSVALASEVGGEQQAMKLTTATVAAAHGQIDQDNFLEVNTERFSGTIAGLLA